MLNAHAMIHYDLVAVMLLGNFGRVMPVLGHSSEKKVLLCILQIVMIQVVHVWKCRSPHFDVQVVMRRRNLSR